MTGRVMQPQTHDYRRGSRCWGHDISYSVLPGDKLKASGWGRGIVEGDYILLTDDSGGETRYRFLGVRYEWDPPDQWFGTLAFAPRP